MIGEIKSSEIIRDYIEFSNEDIIELTNRIFSYQSINIDNFNSYNSTYEFYEKSDTYIYDLLYNNISIQQLSSKIKLFSPDFFKMITNPTYKSFMEFGGGVGLFCEIIKSIRPDFNVNYFDIKSKVSDFATWRFNKRKINVNVNIIDQDNPTIEGSYDVIFTDAVIEHIEENKQISYIRKLSRCVNTNGMMCLIVDLEGKNDKMPMHFNVNIINIHNTLEQSHMVCVYGRNTFSSIWIKV